MRAGYILREFHKSTIALSSNSMAMDSEEVGTTVLIGLGTASGLCWKVNNNTVVRVALAGFNTILAVEEAQYSMNCLERDASLYSLTV